MKKKNVVLVVALIVFFTNAPSLLSRSSSSYFDSYLIRYGSKYHIPDLKMIRAQIQQESNFNFLLVNRENPCDSKIDAPWSFGPLQINRGCNPWFSSSDSDGSFNSRLWQNPDYYFNSTLRLWMEVYTQYKTNYHPACSGSTYVTWTVAAWNAGPPPAPYQNCDSKPYDPRGYVPSVERWYYSLQDSFPSSLF